MDDLHDYYSAACRVVTRAREQLLNGLSATGPEVGVLDKGNSDFQTSLDVDIEQDIRDYLTHRFPDHSIVGEELANVVGESELTWYVDPIDGTHNLMMGRPEIAISVALYQGDCPLVAIIDLPMRNQTFSAYAHDQISPPRRVRDQHKRRVLVGIPGEFAEPADRSRLSRLLAEMKAPLGLRCTGALAYDLATMLSGELDARVSFSAKSVDVAAGAALLQFAGCIVTNLDGTPFQPWSGNIAASWTPELHKWLLTILNEETHS